MTDRTSGFRRWRRTRPFWGAVFAVLAGVELIAIPLAPLQVSIHQGMPGVASWFAGAILIAAGVLACTQPQQRSFYGVLAVLAAVASFVTSNLGGFLLGMLLGLVGGALIFAWAPKVPKPRETIVDLGEPRPRHARARRAMAVGVLPAALGAQLTTTPSPTATPTDTATPAPTATAAATPSAPAASTTDTGTTGTTGTGGTTTSPKAASGTACPEVPQSPTAAEARTLIEAYASCDGGAATAAKATAGTGLTVSTDAAKLTADSLTMYGMDYGGETDLPTSGGTSHVLKFTMTKAALTGVTQSAGHTGLATPSLTFGDGVTMYVAKISGKLLGIPVTLEPGSPLLSLLTVLKLPVTVLTGVTSTQPVVTAGTADATALAVKGI